MTLPKMRLALAAATLPLSACCTIFNGSEQTLHISSPDPGVSYVIENKKQETVAHGDAPADLKLKGYEAPYKIRFTDTQGRSQDYTVDQGVTKWFFGNLLIGGLIGFGVDAATGSLYVLRPDRVDIDMASGRNRDLPEATPAPAAPQS